VGWAHLLSTLVLVKKLPISVCIISGAEAHRIARTLESVAPWSSEIVVVLNEEVTDGTAEIAQRYGAKVTREPWKGFIGQKNSAAEKANAPWLLNVDADEIVSAELAAEISQVTASSQGGHAAYEFPRCTYYCGRWIRHGDWYPDHVLRLWRKGSARWGGEEPHASLEVNGTVGRLRSDLLHHSNETIAQQIAKMPPYHAPFVRRRLAAGRSPGYFSLVIRPWWKFMRGYVFRLGFLDGWQGFYIAALASFSTLTRQVMVREAEVSKEEKG
jgi:glycosyltransferase involved in cell wall biosynthesis